MWIFAADGREDEKPTGTVRLPWKLMLHERWCQQQQQKKPGNH